jgi:outer membrane protein OmpA-like peptidoglycan-associated protein
MENRATIPLAEEPIEYQLTLEDDRGSVFVSPPLSIPVRQLTISRKKIEQVGDREIERFSLILFDFNESAVKGQNASIVSIIASRTQNATSVTIAGSTDVIGSEAYNGQLARSRATETAKALGLTGTARIVSTGEQGPYTMSLPEGRAYSRTVVVTVETPITRR